MSGRFVYVENGAPEGSPYHVSKAAVLTALQNARTSAEVVVRSESDPDFVSLGMAHYFIGSGFDPLRLKRHAQNLAMVHCTSAGVEKYLPLDWLPKRARFTNSSGVHAKKGGPFGAMAVLMVLEGVPRHVSNQRQHIWQAELSTGVSGKTVVCVGTGKLGSAIATHLRPFGVRVLGVSRSGEENPAFDRVFPRDDLDRLLTQADCLVMACPLTPATREMISARELALMKPGSGIFNVARAGVMNYAALVETLKNRKLNCAILDVFDTEPLSPQDTLWDVPNLIVFPHISCDDHDGYIDRCLEIFAENVRRSGSGETLLNVVDPVFGY